MEEVLARVAAAKLELEQALADADVARKLLANESNPSPLALREPQVARAEAALRAAQTSLSLAKTNLERTQIQAALYRKGRKQICRSRAVCQPWKGFRNCVRYRCRPS